MPPRSPQARPLSAADEPTLVMHSRLVFSEALSQSPIARQVSGELALGRSESDVVPVVERPRIIGCEGRPGLPNWNHTWLLL